MDPHSGLPRTRPVWSWPDRSIACERKRKRQKDLGRNERWLVCNRSNKSAVYEECEGGARLPGTKREEKAVRRVAGFLCVQVSLLLQAPACLDTRETGGSEKVTGRKQTILLLLM